MNTLVVYCHPDPASFTAACRDRVLAALARRGHEVRLRDLYGEGFDPLFSADERSLHLEPGAAPAVAGHVADLQWCRQLILVHPTWWSAQPAMLKGWFERVLVNGVAWHLPAGAKRLRPGLRNVRRIVTVTSHGSSKLTNALEGEVGKRFAGRMLRSLCHPLARTKWIALYGIDTSTAEQRAAFLERIDRALQ
ncbi:MAG: NAD(P)H-dependent oxidoreductase [Ilumatobacteraceae bacterium]